MLSKSDVFFSAKENEQMWARVTSADLVLQCFLPNNRNKSWWCANLKQIPLRSLSELALRFTTMDAKKEQTSSISNLSSALTLAFKKLLPLMKNILIRGFAEIPTLYQQIAPPYTLALVKVVVGRLQEQLGLCSYNNVVSVLQKRIAEIDFSYDYFGNYTAKAGLDYNSIALRS